MRARTVVVAVIATPGLLGTLASPRQQIPRVVIQGDAACPACIIRLTPVARIQDTTHGSGVVNTASLAVSARSGFFLQDFQTAEYLAYDARGSYRLSFGRRGQGPGEFGPAAGATIDRADSLWMYDLTNSRLNIFAPGTLQFVRTVRFSQRLDEWVLLTPKSLVATVSQPDKSRRLILVDQNGANIRQIGPANPVPNEAVLLRPSRTPGHFWRVKARTYEIEEWDSSGRMLRVIERRIPEWWSRATAIFPVSQNPSALEPQLISVREDSSGMLWVLTRVPNQEYYLRARVPAPNTTSRGGDEGRLGTATPGTAVPNSFMLEILDVRRGRVQYARAYASQPYMAVGNDYVVEMSVDKNTGFQALTFNRASLITPSP